MSMRRRQNVKTPKVQFNWLLKEQKKNTSNAVSGSGLLSLGTFPTRLTIHLLLCRSFQEQSFDGVFHLVVMMLFKQEANECTTRIFSLTVTNRQNGGLCTPEAYWIKQHEDVKCLHQNFWQQPRQKKSFERMSQRFLVERWGGGDTSKTRPVLDEF